MNLRLCQFGIDRLLESPDRLELLREHRVGLVGHPASTTADFRHSLDALMSANVPVKAAFGPQHGMRGDKQDNMIESEDYLDEQYNIPVYSLYGAHRKPTPAMLADIDIVLIDLQDVGCRIYTYLTTLVYFINACADHGKKLWVLDRPNPAGRKVEGLCLVPGEESFVGCAPIPMRHGLTLGEFARWYHKAQDLSLDLDVLVMESYDPGMGPGYGWPVRERPWINPSPNASSLNMARCYPGTVLLEGTELSEGRGTTIPLELVGAPDLPIDRLLAAMEAMAPEWLKGAILRPCYFEPTFHKHEGQLCHGIQMHTDHADYNPLLFSPFRIILLFLKAIRKMQPDYVLWRHHEYEYELSRIPIDVINGSSLLREWVDDPEAGIADMEKLLLNDEQKWQEASAPFLLYGQTSR